MTRQETEQKYVKAFGEAKSKQVSLLEYCRTNGLKYSAYARYRMRHRNKEEDNHYGIRKLTQDSKSNLRVQAVSTTIGGTEVAIGYSSSFNLAEIPYANHMVTVDSKEKHYNGVCFYLWTNFNSPVVVITDSINVFCSKEESDTQSEKLYLNDVKAFFDYLYNKSQTRYAGFILGGEQSAIVN